jgi:hypothetical protein
MIQLYLQHTFFLVFFNLAIHKVNQTRVILELDE